MDEFTGGLIGPNADQRGVQWKSRLSGTMRTSRGWRQRRRADPVCMERGRSGTTGGKAQEHVRAVLETSGHHMDDLHVALHMTLDRQQPGLHDGLAVFRHHLGPDDKIGDAGLVLEGDEADALGAARPLPDKDQARKLNSLPVAAAPSAKGAASGSPRRPARRPA